ncbi:MAG: phosphoribosyltransferase family protein [Caulobacterales bacterium]
MNGDNLRVLYDEAAIARRVEELAEELSKQVDSAWTLVSLMQGAMPFTTDLMRALAMRGVHPLLNCLWLESYRDARASSGQVVVRADISRPIDGMPALIIDDVFDSGRTIAYARAHLIAKGASHAIACAFIRKPAAMNEPIEYVGFDAPDEFLVGYGMDVSGRYRGFPFVGVAETP